jgi:hypothetical protein
MLEIKKNKFNSFHTDVFLTSYHRYRTQDGVLRIVTVVTDLHCSHNSHNDQEVCSSDTGIFCSALAVGRPDWSERRW